MYMYIRVSYRWGGGGGGGGGIIPYPSVAPHTCFFFTPIKKILYETLIMYVCKSLQCYEDLF